MKYWIESFAINDRKFVDEIFIENSMGNRVSFLNLGARINRFLVRDNNRLENIILGYSSIDELLNGRSYYYGATIGPVAGRIAGGKFSLNNKEYQLDLNDGDNHLHGGQHGYDIQVFDYSIEKRENEISIIFQLTNIDKKINYPGNTNFILKHTFDEDNKWTIDYSVTAESDTLVNPTNHVYFNLNGDNSKPVINHILHANIEGMIKLEEDGIPTGNVFLDEGTVMDLNKPQSINEIVHSEHIDIKTFKGLDQPFKLDNEKQPVVTLLNNDNGRMIKVYTDAPVAILYTHNKIDTSMKIWGRELLPFAGLAIECQGFPDAINHDDFGNTVLKAGETFISKTVYQFLENRGTI